MSSRDVLLLAALTACGSSSKVPCETVAARETGEIRALLVERCVKDDWSADARDCVAAVSDHEACRALLGADADRFLAQEASVKRSLRAEAELARLQKDLPPGIDPTKVTVVIEIPLIGDSVINGKALGESQLDSVFAVIVQRDRATQLLIKAAKGVSHGRIVDIMERAKRAGLTHLAIGTSS